MSSFYKRTLVNNQDKTQHKDKR